MLSLGSSGRCFFSVGVAGAADRVVADNVAALMTTGEAAGRGTMVTGMATGEDWEVALEEVEGAAVLWERVTGGGWSLATWGEMSDTTKYFNDLKMIVNTTNDDKNNCPLNKICTVCYS